MKLFEHTNCLIVLRRDTGPIVLYFDRVQPVILEPYLCLPRSAGSDQGVFSQALPIDVAPASKLFSTSSFTTEHRSTMTWPDWIWWTCRIIPCQNGNSKCSNPRRISSKAYRTSLDGLDGGHCHPIAVVLSKLRGSTRFSRHSANSVLVRTLDTRYGTYLSSI